MEARIYNWSAHEILYNLMGYLLMESAFNDCCMFQAILWFATSWSHFPIQHNEIDFHKKNKLIADLRWISCYYEKYKWLTSINLSGTLFCYVILDVSFNSVFNLLYVHVKAWLCMHASMNGSSLVQVIACHLFSTKPSGESIVTYCIMDP